MWFVNCSSYSNIRQHNISYSILNCRCPLRATSCAHLLPSLFLLMPISTQSTKCADLQEAMCSTQNVAQWWCVFIRITGQLSMCWLQLGRYQPNMLHHVLEETKNCTHYQQRAEQKMFKMAPNSNSQNRSKGANSSLPIIFSGSSIIASQISICLKKLCWW